MMNQKTLLITGGLALVGFYFYGKYKKEEASKSIKAPAVLQYEPAWNNPNGAKMGIGFDGKPAMIYRT